MKDVATWVGIIASIVAIAGVLSGFMAWIMRREARIFSDRQRELFRGEIKEAVDASVQSKVNGKIDATNLKADVTNEKIDRLSGTMAEFMEDMRVQELRTAERLAIGSERMDGMRRDIDRMNVPNIPH